MVPPNHYTQKRIPIRPAQLRRQRLAGLSRKDHVASRGTYGDRRMHAELTMGVQIIVCKRTRQHTPAT